MRVVVAIAAVLLCLCLSQSVVDAATKAFCSNVREPKIYSAGEKILFNMLIFQKGGGYNTLLSQYTCPKSGIYFFTFSLYSSRIRSTGPVRSSAELVINTSRRIDALSFNSNIPYIVVHTAQSIIQKCNKGDVVYLRSRYNDNSIGAFERRTSFCGFCISC